MRIIIEHTPGYSSIDHVGPELVRMAEQEFVGRPQTFRSAQAAIRRAERKAKKLAKSNPACFGVFRFPLPFLRIRREP